MDDRNEHEVVVAEEYSSVFQKAAEATEIAITVGRLSLLQKKILNVFLKYAKPNLMDREEHSITLKELIRVLEFDSNDYNPILSAIEQLPKVTVVWNYLGKDHKVTKDFGAGGILSQVELIRGVISYSYPMRIRQMLHAPKKFSVIDIKLQNEFSSSYSLTLYEILEKYRGLTDMFPVEKFKDVLGIDANNVTYTEFKNFNRKIIKPAINEINAISDLNVEAHFHKNGRNIVGISFHVTQNKQQSLGLPVPLHYNKALHQSLLDIGCTEKQADSILASYPEDYIRGNLEVVVERFKAGQIRSRSGPVPYLIKALAEDFRPREIPLERKQKELAKRDEDWKRTLERFELLKSGYSNDRMQQARQLFQAQSEDVKVMLNEDFIAHIQKTSPIILQQYRKSGLKSGIVKTTFYQFIGEKLKLSCSEQDFKKYIQQQGHDLVDFAAIMEKEPFERWYKR